MELDYYHVGVSIARFIYSLSSYIDKKEVLSEELLKLRLHGNREGVSGEFLVEDILGLCSLV